ncbi:MAG: ACP S-malonyltransferase [Syntrophomonadaceae bacterium]|nr:ACP S-malonyltransferase [Syntrophomonadaceae bacterium]
MERIAFVFPGQGAQYKGMGRDLAQNCKEAAEVFAAADEIAGYKISTLCFEDTDGLLDKTEYAQPALLTTSLAVYEAVKKQGIIPTVVAGLSLGEYTALVAAGALSFREALPLVQVRARLMQEAVPLGKGAMAAVMGLDDEVVKDACRQTGGIVDIANYNAPGQVVISGEKEAVIAAGSILKEAGGRVRMLEVSVPSHSQLMYDAAVELSSYLEQIKWQEPVIEVVSNVNARCNTYDEFADLLVKQLFSPVLWEQSVRYMMNKVEYFIEIGPGSTLTGLIKRIDRNRVLGNIEDVRSLKKIIEKVKP